GWGSSDEFHRDHDGVGALASRGVRAGARAGKLSQRGDREAASRPVHRAPALALPALQEVDRSLGQRAAPLLRAAPRPVPPLSQGHLVALPDRGAPRRAPALAPGSPRGGPGPARAPGVLPARAPRGGVDRSRYADDSRRRDD